MNQKISKLPDRVINQIAAGEVVENPASIVKELIENSLDAGAQRIGIEIVNGGQQLIRIEDDGCGMSPEDALLCLERHATSKIQAVEDLDQLATMGFRGEALAAIASVSHFELTTSDGIGTQITAEGGRVIAVKPAARNRGTTIEIRSVFYNVPARKKFQKSASANAAQITRIVEIIALAHPEVAFSLNRKTFASAGWKERIEEILGEHEHEVKRANIFGFVASPAKAMASRTGQYVFINRRPIFSPLIAKAVKQGFGTRIPEHHYPRFVLFLEIPPDTVDVNVHPQKREVRFRDEGWIFRLVEEAVASTFALPVNFLNPLSFTPPPISFTPTFSFDEPLCLSPSLPLVFPEKPLAILGSYLLLQKEHLILVDLRGAHARILFESLKEEKGASQALMWPLAIELDRGDEGVAEALNALGIECRVLNRTLVVDALPPFLEPSQFPDFFASWKGEKNIEQTSTRFCRMAKKQYSLDEGFLLWQRLQKCVDRLYDPLGNVIWVEMKEEELWTILGQKR